jgi:hypothetical protein
MGVLGRLVREVLVGARDRGNGVIDNLSLLSA